MNSMSNLSESIRMPVLQTAQKSLDRLASRTPWLRLANQRENLFETSSLATWRVQQRFRGTEVEIQSQLPLRTSSRFSFLLNPIPWSFGMFSNDPWSSNIVSALSFVQKLTSCKIMNHSLLINDSGAKMQMQRLQKASSSWCISFLHLHLLSDCSSASNGRGAKPLFAPEPKYFLA